MSLAGLDPSQVEEAHRLAALPKESLVEITISLGEKLRLQQQQIEAQQRQITELSAQVALLMRTGTVPHGVDSPSLPLTNLAAVNSKPIRGNQVTLPHDISHSGDPVASEEALHVPHVVTVPTVNVFNPLAGLPQHLPGTDKRCHSPIASEEDWVLKKSKSSASSPTARGLDSSGKLENILSCDSVIRQDMNMDDDGDINPNQWKLVDHRKGRKGIPIVLRPSGGRDLQHVPPTKLHTEIVSIAGEPLLAYHFSDSGSLTVEVASERAVNALLATTSLTDTNITACVAHAYLMNTALIKGVPVRYSVDELLETLSPQGVTRVRRRHRAPAVGRNESTPMNQIIVHFRDNAERPAEMDFGFFKRKVRDFTLAPPRCYECQKFGHTSKFCKSESPKCSICSGPHQWKECLPNAESKCANCAGSHPANAPHCPTRLEAIRKARLFVTGSKKSDKGRHTPSPKKYSSAPRDPAGKSTAAGAEADVAREVINPARRVSEKLSFARAVAAVNGVSSDLIPELLAKPQGSLEEQQRVELAVLMRKHSEQRKAKDIAPTSPQSIDETHTSQREALLSANYEFILRSLRTLPPGREREGIQILLDWERVMSCRPSTIPNYG